MNFPTIDQTRAAVYIIAAIALSVALVWSVSRGEYQILTPMVAALLAVISGIDGLALHKRNSSGADWDSPKGQKQDQLPPLP